MLSRRPVCGPLSTVVWCSFLFLSSAFDECTAAMPMLMQMQMLLVCHAMPLRCAHTLFSFVFSRSCHESVSPFDIVCGLLFASSSLGFLHLLMCWSCQSIHISIFPIYLSIYLSIDLYVSVSLTQTVSSWAAHHPWSMHCQAMNLIAKYTEL